MTEQGDVMEKTRLTLFARTDVGRVHSENEDAFLTGDLETGVRIPLPANDVAVPDEGVLLVLSDGMGGYAAGETASALVVESLLKYLSEKTVDRDVPLALINTAVSRVNADVVEAARAADKRGMGATLTAAIVRGQEALIFEVGDSRAYLFRRGRLRQITKDQSYVQMLVDAGALTPEQAGNSPRKNLILQAVGRDKQIQPAVRRLRLCRGDHLLICCDGISNVVSHAEIESMFTEDAIETLCDRLIDSANERGGLDNLTAMVARVDGEALAPADESTDAEPEILQAYEGPTSTRTFSSIPPPIPQKRIISDEPPPEPPKLVLRLLSAWLIVPLLFLAAGGSFTWWNAWFYCLTLLVPMTLFVLYMKRRDPIFLARRLKLKEREPFQRRLLAFGSPLLAAVFVIPGLDLRFGWSDMSEVVSASALGIALIGHLIILRTFFENPWAGRTVETYSDQQVVSTGPYGIVRHPMYTGALVLFLATPAALGSWWGTLPALAFVAVFVLRIQNEEAVLVRALEGYDAYQRKVRYRLLPFIW